MSRTLAALVLLVFPAVAAAQTPHRVKGTVVDPSAAVLPGTVVTATAADGRQLAIAITNAAGEFSFDRLPAGPVTLVFRLDGFAEAKLTVTVPADGAAPRDTNNGLVQRLELSSFSETVTVRADPPPSPRILAPVPEHDPAAVCAPAKAEGVVPPLGAVTARRRDAKPGLFAAGDELVIDPGRVNVLNVGDHYVARRRYATPLTDAQNRVVMGEHSSGLLQVIDVDATGATAVVIYACDEIMSGDYLAPFQPEPPVSPDPAGVPMFENAMRLLFGDAGQMLGSTNRLLVIGHGRRDGVRAGQRLTVFRRALVGRATPIVLGEAVVVSVRRESATIRIERSTDVIFVGDSGDWAAPQRQPTTNK